MAVPEPKKWLVDGFCRYTRNMVTKRFTAFGVQFATSPSDMIRDDHSMMVFANHVGWWDPIVAMLLNKAYFPDRTFYAPIDAVALNAYGIFRKLGFYGLELDRFHGAAEFLRTSRDILSNPKASIWITPEGQFADARDHTKPLMPGLAHLAATSERVLFVPLAIEYPFWEEPRPMVLVRFGEAVTFDGISNKKQCAEKLEESMRSNQKDLAQSVIHRRIEAFEYLIPPRAARTSWYDTMRSWTAWFQGRPFDPRHSTVTKKPESQSEP